MSIAVVEEREGNVLVLQPVGKIDGQNAHAFETTVMGHISGGERRLVVDCSRMEVISSAGLRGLLLATRAMRTTSGTIVLCGLRQNVKLVVQMSGFQRIVPIKVTREAAVEFAG
jgi:anti-anti-sigma factor